jgi:hypothetical protein
LRWWDKAHLDMIITPLPYEANLKETEMKVDVIIKRGLLIRSWKKWKYFHKRQAFETYRKTIMAESWAEKRLSRKILIAWHQMVSDEDPAQNQMSSIHYPEHGSILFTQYHS